MSHIVNFVHVGCISTYHVNSKFKYKSSNQVWGGGGEGRVGKFFKRKNISVVYIINYMYALIMYGVCYIEHNN